jgi:S1-C subfamily serine protease
VADDLDYDEVVGPLLELVGRGREGISGGPVLDRTGRVAGMVVATRRGGEERVLAIPSERLAEFLAYMNVDWGGDGRSGLSSHGAGESPPPKPRPGVPGPSPAVVVDVLQVGCSK